MNESRIKIIFWIDKLIEKINSKEVSIDLNTIDALNESKKTLLTDQFDYIEFNKFIVSLINNRYTVCEVTTIDKQIILLHKTNNIYLYPEEVIGVVRHVYYSTPH